MPPIHGTIHAMVGQLSLYSFLVPGDFPFLLSKSIMNVKILFIVSRISDCLSLPPCGNQLFNLSLGIKFIKSSLVLKQNKTQNVFIR